MNYQTRIVNRARAHHGVVLHGYGCVGAQTASVESGANDELPVEKILSLPCARSCGAY